MDNIKDHENCQNISNLKTKNVFIWGSSGTGKTILLAEALSMRVSFYKKAKVNYKVFVTTYRFNGGKLLEDLMKKHLVHFVNLEEVRFIELLDLCKGI